MKRSLKERVVIITGASSGIGRALATELAGRGARLALGARRIDRLNELNAQLGGKHLCVPTDVALPEQCERLIAETIAKWGRVDTLVCNAGYGFFRTVMETSPREMLDVFQTNVMGTLDCIRPAVAQMRQQEPADGWRGQIMIVSSAVARRALPNLGGYAATKAAQLSLGEALRVELADEQIAVTTVHPGGTESEFDTVAADLSQGRSPKRLPGERRQTAEQVAKAMAAAIERPRPEVWPIASYHLLTSVGTLFPGLVDKMMKRRREQIGGGEGKL